MTWMALLITAVFLGAAWRYRADTRDGQDWQPWRIGEAIGPGRRPLSR